MEQSTLEKLITERVARELAKLDAKKAEFHRIHLEESTKTYNAKKVSK